MPETSAPNILLRRAVRLRKLTGDQRLRSQSDIDQKKLKSTAVLLDVLIKPLAIAIKDSAIAFFNLCTAVKKEYTTQVPPIVYIGFYGSNLGTLGVVACIIGAVIDWAYLYYYL